MKKTLILMIVLTALLLCAACGGTGGGTGDTRQPSSETPASSQKNTETGTSAATATGATLTVTSVFGAEELFRGSSEVTGDMSVMDLLEANVTVKTSYGGSFVDSIEGYASITGKVKQDWFYYVNGIIGSAGANDYLLQNGDVVWWDYHLWNDDTSFSPAVIGSYPQPFLSGFGGENPGTLILAQDIHMEQAQALAQCLQQAGVASVRVEAFDEKKLEEAPEIVIAVADWSILSREAYWQGLAENRHKTGLFLKMAEGSFTGFDGLGREADSYGAGTGAIFATGTGMGDATPLWAVTGTDSAGTEAALDVLINSPEKIAAKMSCIVDRAGDLIALPVNNQ